ncbi:MAG TPA: hypothetical protein VL026_04610 [Rhizomicrobium sp.]|nr:hypothetical protein [Rhizomicrobium sp.]
MRKLVAGASLTVALLMYGCSNDFRAEDYAAGRNGEPPRALKPFRVYSREFVAEQKNYVLALGQIHAFLIANNFSTSYPSCFNDVLDIRVTANIAKHKKRFPCVALQAEKGSPTKIYLNVTIDDVMFNQLSHNNRLIYTVSIFGRNDLTNTFASVVEPRLRTLYTEVSTNRNHAAPN